MISNETNLKKSAYDDVEICRCSEKRIDVNYNLYNKYIINIDYRNIGILNKFKKTFSQFFQDS